MMDRCVKIVCCYFGERRNFHNTPSNIIDFIKINIENEINIDNGINTDVILVNNNIGNIEANEFLNSYDGVKTKNGKLIVETRENFGGSFGSYYYSFLKYKDEYDYWFFCEDDVLVYKNGYIKDFIEFLDSDDNLGFISLAPISSSPHPKHSGGGCGLTSTNKFLRSRSIADIEHFLKTTSKLNETYQTLETYEIMFTNNFIISKMDIKNHPQYSPYCLNFESHTGQKSNYVKNNKEQEIIYKVGF